MLLKSTISVQQETELEIPNHSFYKNDISDNISEFTGVIDECYINIWMFKDEQVMLENSATQDRQDKIIKCHQTWEHISEEEFFENLDKALKDFNFKPSLRVVTCKEGSEVTI